MQRQRPRPLVTWRGAITVIVALTGGNLVAQQAPPQRTKTDLWIEHDFVANAKLKKAPAYYD